MPAVDWFAQRVGSDFTMSEPSDFFSCLDSTALIVTVRSEELAAGCLVAFATQCSIYPPRLLVCLSELNLTTRIASTASALGVHVLGDDQAEVASLFGTETGNETDKLSKVRWHAGVAGAPILDECARWFEGVVVERILLGDHVGHVLEVVEVGRGPASGTLMKSDVGSLVAGHPAEEIRSRGNGGSPA